ncbi:leucine-rich repeat-containing protein 72-like [Bolinopsis microptera]|uniref:leucine-rich repeat-containing protein 72-like n=1 Tax=Bolinopsis microptera TaxID=2820187 RepID=UPI00307B0BD6
MDVIKTVASVRRASQSCMPRKSENFIKPVIPRKINSTKVTENITEQLKRQGIRCCTDVCELYLANNNFVDIPTLGEYKALHVLWLNNNKIYKVDFLKTNFQITELYLQQNMIVNIGGALKHLSCLQILMLHANQLTCSHTTVKELKNMLSLHTLNLFGNPIAQEECYRLFVIHNISSLKLLDRQAVSYNEVSAARRLFAPQLVRINDSIKFGRREFNKEHFPPKRFTGKTVRYIRVGDNPHSRASLSPRRNTTPMSYSLFDWETSGREFLYSKTRSPPRKLTVSIK